MDAARVAAPGRRPLSPAQWPILRSEVLHRDTSRWTQLTVVQMRGAIDPDRLSRALDTVVARHPALRTQIRRRGREVWQEFGASGIRLIRHDQPTPPGGQQAAIDAFVRAAGGRRFPLDGPALFRPDLLILSLDASVLLLSLHHIAADGIALAGLAPQIAAAYRGENGSAATDGAYENWLDRQAAHDFMPGIEAARRFYQQTIDNTVAKHASLYDRPAETGTADPPHLPEATCIMAAETTGALRTLARANRATPFIVPARSIRLRARTGPGRTGLAVRNLRVRTTGRGQSDRRVVHQTRFWSASAWRAARRRSNGLPQPGKPGVRSASTRPRRNPN